MSRPYSLSRRKVRPVNFECEVNGLLLHGIYIYIYIFPYRVFPNWNGNSVNSANSENLKNFWSMNWGQFKDPLCYLCFPDPVVASWFLTQEVAGSNTISVDSTEFNWEKLLMNQTISYIWWTQAWIIIFFDPKMILWGNISNGWHNMSPKSNRGGTNTEIDV